MSAFDDFVCETRYCPECSAAIFCRTGPNEVTIFYTTEEMDVSLSCCPTCDLDLLSGNRDLLLDQPRPSAGEATPRREPRRVSRAKAGKGDIVESLHRNNAETFPTKAAAERAFDALGEELRNRLLQGENVGWPELGTFKLKRRKARVGRNPQTGGPMEIPAQTSVSFTPAKSLKETINS
ncbi:MAG: HU family DNA-binding protein [Desulfovibrionales bacterium]